MIGPQSKRVGVSSSGYRFGSRSVNDSQAKNELLGVVEVDVAEKHEQLTGHAAAGVSAGYGIGSGVKVSVQMQLSATPNRWTGRSASARPRSPLTSFVIVAAVFATQLISS